MKRIIIFCLSILLICVLVSCSSSKETKIDYSPNTSPVGAFSLIGPSEGAVITENPTFSWTPAENAEHYTLEVSTSDQFTSEDGDVYVKKVGITSTSFTLFSTLNVKETTYYWKVTASNGGKTTSKAQGSFFFDSIKGEVSFPIQYADEWKVHEMGSKATVSVDKTDFFGNGQNSLRVSFVSEDTNQAGGGIMSDGWIVLTNTAELEMWGNDAFYFNFYYSGNDSSVSVRVIDEDNEYWVAPIKLAQNAKQTIILNFSDFKLRLSGDTPIMNQKFDYNRIKSIELCFEKTFGDGVVYISDIKSIAKENYSDLYVDQLNFLSTDIDSYLYEGQNFTPTIGEDGQSLTLSYSGLIGYGITKVPIEKLAATGDAIKLKINLNNVPQDANIILRVIEEDGDRWAYKILASSIPDEEFVIPYSAFFLSEYKGDGARQFYFIKQFQFGVEHKTANYNPASFTIENLEIASLEDEIENLYIKEISNDGVIEDFSNYQTNAALYYVWQNTSDNKDEQMECDELYSFGSNGSYGVFYYKSDMYPATYGVQFDGIANFTSISFLAQDRSVKSDNPIFSYLDDAHASLQLTLFIQRPDTEKVETYSYLIPSLSGKWTNYTVALSDFTRDAGFYGAEYPIASENIRGLSFSLGYAYKTESGANYPVYMKSNPVFFDNISLSTETETSQIEASSTLKPSDSDPLICIVDNFDGGTNWKDVSTNPVASPEKSTDTASGTGSSLKLSYTGKTTSPYNTYLYESHVEFDSTVNAKGLSLSIKGDGKTSVTITLSRIVNGKLVSYAYEIKNVAEGWNKYEIGLSKFIQTNSTSGSTPDRTMIPDISVISISLTNKAEDENGFILVDDFYMDGNLKYTTLTITPLGE